MADNPLEISTALADRYRVERELGRGGMATVYLARDLKHKRQVAVKVLHPEQAAAIGSSRFAREIEIAAGLNHPHILTLIDSGEADGFLYYAMPFVEGGSLRDRLDRETRLAVPEAIRIVDQVASALHHAHERGVIHRDIKPENILLAGDQAVVADFGIARALQSAGGQKLTETGMAIGTLAYMSPEQAFGQANIDRRTDVYALGCVLFEMLAGRPPFAAPTPQAFLAQHAIATAPRLRTDDPDVPLFIDRAIGKALAKEPERRFRSTREFAETLRSEAVVAPVGRKRLAILPPVNITNDPEQQFLVLGLHEAMISHVGAGNVAVLARTSVSQYQGSEKPAREICRELTVDALVESSVFRSGSSIGVQARLIDGNTEEGLWSGSFDGDIGNVMSLFRELSGAIAEEVHGALVPESPSATARPAVHPAAYENYMRGRVCQQNFNPHDLDRALKYYEAALQIQPDYAPAYAGMALIWGSKVVLGLVPPMEYGPKWLESAGRAVALDPGLAEGHQALAQAYTWFDFDWDRAEAAYKRAIALDPNEPQARIFYSHFLAMLHRREESDVEIKAALEIDPFNPFTQMLYGIQLGLTGRHEQALEQLASVPPNPLGSFAMSWQHFKLGRLSEGLRHYVRYFELLGDSEMVSVMQVDEAGPQAAMIRGAETLVERAGRMFVKPNNMVHLFSWGGDVDRAMEWLDRSWEMRDHEIAYMAALATSDALRSDPRFHAFLRRLRLPVPE